jgi:hypothetical protein
MICEGPFVHAIQYVGNQKIVIIPVISIAIHTNNIASIMLITRAIFGCCMNRAIALPKNVHVVVDEKLNVANAIDALI